MGILTEEYKMGTSKYVGEFRDGKRHGEGIQHSAEGTVIEGNFMNNEINGFNKFTYVSGNIYIGDYSQETGKHGPG